MANTIKTLQGELLVSEVESITLDNVMSTLVKMPHLNTKVIVTGKSGIKYDLAVNVSSVIAMKIYNAAVNFVAGTGHTVFDPAQAVK